MGTYIGSIKMKNIPGSGKFFNFKPLAELKNAQLHILSPAEQADLLKNSERRDINFKYYPYSAELQKMQSRFPDNSLTVFDFEPKDLEDNKDSSSGNYRPTGYKVSTFDMLQQGKIRHLKDVGIYYLLTDADFEAGYDFIHSPLIALKPSFLSENDQVLIDYSGHMFGPYNVFKSESLSTLCIGPKVKEQKYTASGYIKDDLSTCTLFDPDISVAIRPKNVSQQRFDLIPDSDLLNSFFEELSNTPVSTGTVQINNLPQLIEQYRASILSGNVLSSELLKARSEKLIHILSSESNADNILNRASNVLINLILRCKDEPAVSGWLESAIKDPDVLNQLGDLPVITEKTEAKIEELNKKEEEIKQLNVRKKSLEQSITQLQQQAEDEKQRAVEQINDQKKLEIQKADAELQDICNRLKVAKDLDELDKRHQKLMGAYEAQEELNKKSETAAQKICKSFNDYFDEKEEEAVKVAFDGFLSSKMLQSAAKWEAEQVDKSDNDFLININNLTVAEKSPAELADYLYTAIHSVRQNYSRNTILNIAICIAQGFLTVFSGEPGCGKTSICNLFAQALGLNRIASSIRSSQSDTGTDFEHSSAKYENAACINRYIPVSVEKGWTSKRDFIGYYNPLSKTFDQNNSRVYQALRLLDKEARNNIHKLPLLILLDEANLSSMEYYWSDFMNICDDLNFQSTVNLGENYIFHIPETLHFLATINNDHTTEVLSPRLIDRAWIITLPEQYAFSPSSGTIPDDFIEIISWDSLRNAFLPTPDATLDFSPSVKNAYDEIVSKLRSEKFSVSPRVDQAIRRYWTTAKDLFEPADAEQTEPDIVALDYAVAQRLLPKISGNGEDFRKWLTELREICTNNSLSRSAQILKDIIERGDQQMNYYQFFC